MLLLVAATASTLTSLSFNQFPLSFFIFSFYRSVFIQSRFSLSLSLALFRTFSISATLFATLSNQKIFHPDPRVIKYFTSDAANIRRVITFHPSTSNEKEEKRTYRNDVIDRNVCIPKCVYIRIPLRGGILESKLMEGERLRRSSATRPSRTRNSANCDELPINSNPDRFYLFDESRRMSFPLHFNSSFPNKLKQILVIISYKG